MYMHICISTYVCVEDYWSELGDAWRDACGEGYLMEMFALWGMPRGHVRIYMS